MTADDDDFVGLFAPANLADDVRRFDVRLEVRIHLQPHHDARTSVRHPLQTIGVFSRDRRGRNLWRVGRILERSRVRQSKTGRPDRSHEDRTRSVTGGP